MSQTLVQYLEKNYPVRINKIVLDFITDYHGEIWIVGCRCIEQENCTYMTEFLLQNQDNADCLNPIDQLTCSINCKLCGITFKKEDIWKVVTHKLLGEFITHLKKRNKVIEGLYLVSSTNSSKQWRVCSLCYMVVVNELTLIEIEQ